MKPIGAAAEAAAKRIRHQKFYWCRLDNDFVDMALWRMVAERLKMPAYQVQAFALRLESFANAAIPRGYVGDFKAGEFATALGMSIEDAARIYAELEHDEIGWIVQEHVATFYERNPDRLDNTASERQQRKRTRDRALRDLAKAARLGTITEEERRTAEADLLRLSTGHVRHAVTHRDSVTVTPQHSTGNRSGPVDNFSDGARGESAGSPKGDAAGAGPSPQLATWLRDQGLRIIVERMALPRSLAETRLERWVRQLQGDEGALAAIVEAADAADLAGAHFHVSVNEQISQRLHDAEGPRLPLMRSFGAPKKQAG